MAAPAYSPSSAVLALRKERESLVLQAYPDGGSPLGRACIELGIALHDYLLVANWQVLSGEPWTYGYGRARGVSAGMSCAPDQAEDMLRVDVLSAYSRMRSYCGSIELDQGKVDALTSFFYNIRIREGEVCHLAVYVKAGNFDAAAGEFHKWTHDGSGAVERGLVISRAVEKAWFLGQPRPAWTLDPHGVPPEGA